MAWDTAGTRRRIVEAATAEFAEHGPDGTTTARIAARAGVNKERIFHYFTDKQTLFAGILAQELATLSSAVSPPPSLADIGEYAARTFDYHQAHPQLARLLVWEGMTAQPTADEANRAHHYADKVAAVVAAQQAGVLDDTVDPAYLMLTVIALAAWWICVPQLVRMMTGASPDEPDDVARRRAFVVAAAERLALPRP